MNDKLEKLADKIWAKEYWDDPNTDKLLPVQLNKFAELIVGECANIYDMIDNGNLVMGTDNYLKALQKTFRS